MPDNSLRDFYIRHWAGQIESIQEVSMDVYRENNIKRGLRNADGTGVAVGLTRIGDVIGYTKDEEGKKIPAEGKLLYRGYNVEDIVKDVIDGNRFGFEEVCYLLLFAELPTKDQLEAFKEILGEKRILPETFAASTILTTPSKNIMNKLMRSILTLYSYDKDPDNISVENVIRQSIDIMGYFPAIIAYAYQAQQTFFHNESLHLHYPQKNLSTAENILRMIRPDGKYTETEAKVLDLCLILHAEHGGGNNSSFTTHVVSSSGTDTYSAITAAVGSLKGPKHGGANIAVINMIKDLKDNVSDYTNYDQVTDYLVRVLNKKANDRSGLVYGMGHAIYTLSDPRAKILKEMARKLAIDTGKMEDFLLCDFIEKKTPELKAEITGVDKPLCANVDLYSGFVYDALGVPVEIATPLFAIGRLPGWCAHRLEELTVGKKIIRPAYVTIGGERDFMPLNRR